jgi:hypothetical protein
MIIVPPVGPITIVLPVRPIAIVLPHRLITMITVVTPFCPFNVVTSQVYF